MKKNKLTPKQANQLMKGCMLFLLASMKYHGLIDQIQQEHWIEQLRDIGIYSYYLKKEETKKEKEEIW